ncbi:MAG: hypothetical protein AAGA20_02730, partial [Planctomycetota bacterium]
MLLSQHGLRALALALSPTLAAQADEADAKAFLDFVGTIESAMADSDPSVFHDAMDVDRFVERVRVGLPEGPKIDAMMEGFKIGFEGSNRMAADIVESLEEYDGTYVFLRMMPDAPTHALFRWAGDDGLEYHELALERGDDGAVRIADILPMSFGQWSSESSREFLVDLVAEQNPSLWERFTGAKPESLAAILKVKEMTEALEDDPAAALEIYDSLPEKTKTRIHVQRLRITAAADIDDETYLAALEDFARFHPDCAAIPLMMIDAHILVDDYDAVREDIDRLEEMVHGDPYLDITRAQILIKEERYDRAREALARAVEQDERLEMPAAWELLEIHLATDDHEQTFRTLDWLYENSD